MVDAIPIRNGKRGRNRLTMDRARDAGAALHPVFALFDTDNPDKMKKNALKAELRGRGVTFGKEKIGELRYKVRKARELELGNVTDVSQEEGGRKLSVE